MSEWVIEREVTGCVSCPFASEADAGVYCSLDDTLAVESEEGPYVARVEAPPECKLRIASIHVRMVRR